MAKEKKTIKPAGNDGDSLNIADYCRQYRMALGFKNQSVLKEYLGAKDIVPSIDYLYIKELNLRLEQIVGKVNEAINPIIRIDDIAAFKDEYIAKPWDTIKGNNLLPRLNNQGRRPENVYFNWMRGFVALNVFKKGIARMFSISEASIKLIGKDDLSKLETFSRSPTADLELTIRGNKKVCLEVQSGFTGLNDIKQHKVREAKTVFSDRGIPTLALHFDIFNGQVAILRLDNTDDADLHWITRHQMEGQTVFNIDQNNFIWRLLDAPPAFDPAMFGF